MDYMHFRYYASTMGRFMKPDNMIPNAANPQSWNLYSYVNNSPINANDPTGHLYISSSMMNSIMAGFGGGFGSSLNSSNTGQTGGGGGVNDGGDSPINLTIPIYFDSNSNLEGTTRTDMFEEITGSIMGSAIQAFGSIGINLDFFDGGDVSIKTVSTGFLGIKSRFEVTTEDKGTEIVPGSLIFVYSNNVIGLLNGAYQLLTDNRTGCVVLNHNSGETDGTHELFHAFRWGNWFSKEIIMNDIYAFAFNKTHLLPPFASFIMRQRAAEYLPANILY